MDTLRLLNEQTFNTARRTDGASPISWWLGLSRDAFAARAAVEAPRMRASYWHSQLMVAERAGRS